MYVNSVYQVNTELEQKPFTSSPGEVSPDGDVTQQPSFQDRLKIFLQQANAYTVTRNAEIHAAAGIFWGYYPTMIVQPKQDSTLKDSAS